MIDLPEELRDAIDADDAEDFMDLLKRRRPEDFRALQALVTLDPDVPPHYRTKALHGLGLWGDPSVVPMIKRVLPQLDERGRISAVSALGRIGNQEAISAISDHIRDRSEQVRKAAVMALAGTDSPAARQTLRDVADRDPASWIRELAQRESP